MEKKDIVQIGGFFGVLLLSFLFNLSFFTTLVLVCIGWYFTEKKL
jgi:hypothetical protein